jgi:N-acetylglucosamine malate deacetylase 1
MKIILCVAPHPDDETLGCGGTLLRHVSEGDKVFWLIGTTISQEKGFSQERVESRRKEIKNIFEAYEFISFKQLDFNTTELDQVPRNLLIQEISNYINEIQPHTIYLPYRNDAHSDHAHIYDATVACTKSFRYPFVKKVCVYETVSETEFGLRTDDPGFKPNMWVDITGFLDQKIEIMKIYQSEISEHPFPRSEASIRACSILRGSTGGCISAEAFMLIKAII